MATCQLHQPQEISTGDGHELRKARPTTTALRSGAKVLGDINRASRRRKSTIPSTDDSSGESEPAEPIETYARGRHRDTTKTLSLHTPDYESSLEGSRTISIGPEPHVRTEPKSPEVQDGLHTIASTRWPNGEVPDSEDEEDYLEFTPPPIFSNPSWRENIARRDSLLECNKAGLTLPSVSSQSSTYLKTWLQENETRHSQDYDEDTDPSYDPIRDPKHWIHEGCNVPVQSVELAHARNERAAQRRLRRLCPD